MVLKLAIDSKMYYFCIPFSCKSEGQTALNVPKNGGMANPETYYSQLGIPVTKK